MTMRKYLVTVHEDGRVTALEFEEPADQALTNYQAGARDACNTIISILEDRKRKCRELQMRYQKAHDRDAWKQALLSEMITQACIETIKSSLH